MDNESNFDFSSDLEVSIYSIQYLLTILVRILFTSSSRETKNEDLQDSSIAKLLKSPPLTMPFIFVISFWIELISIPFELESHGD